MQRKLIFPLFAFAFLFFSCQEKEDKGLLEFSGLLVRQGVTTYQYGSHILLSADSVSAWVLTSSVVDLEPYVGTDVTVEGLWREGYPIEGGPVLLEVVRVR